MKAPEIDCPYCGGHMAAGTAYVHGTALGFLLFGLSHQRLWFRAGSRKEVVVESGSQRAGHRCEKCGVITVHPHESQWDECVDD